jgi:hypothetical protein
MKEKKVSFGMERRALRITLACLGTVLFFATGVFFGWKNSTFQPYCEATTTMYELSDDFYTNGRLIKKKGEHLTLRKCGDRYVSLASFEIPKIEEDKLKPLRAASDHPNQIWLQSFTSLENDFGQAIEAKDLLETIQVERRQIDLGDSEEEISGTMWDIYSNTRFSNLFNRVNTDDWYENWQLYKQKMRTLVKIRRLGIASFDKCFEKIEPQSSVRRVTSKLGFELERALVGIAG